MADNKRRNIIKKTGLLWTIPVINTISLPVHAQTSGFQVTSAGFDVDTNFCMESSPPGFLFTLTNSSGSDITVNSLASSGFNHNSPALPFVITAGQSQQFDVTATDSSITCSGTIAIDYNTTT